MSFPAINPKFLIRINNYATLISEIFRVMQFMSLCRLYYSKFSTSHFSSITL